MNNINYNDFKNICRTCLFNCDLKPIQQDNLIIEVLHKLTGVCFEINDELPQQICLNCYEKINEIHAFAFKCNKTHSNLIKCLNNYKKLNEEKNSLENLKQETNDLIKIKEEITIDEHKIEFVQINDLSSRNEIINDKMKIKQEVEEETNNDLNKFNNEQNINCSAEDDLLRSNTSSLIMDSDTEAPCTPPDITAAANISLLPQKSLEIYENAYQKFMKWRQVQNIHSFSESVILAYLLELSKNFKSSTLWSHYSMLKTTISLKHNINIGEYPKVRTYLKRKNEGHAPKKSRVLEKEQISKFIMEAPDEKFLSTKVILIFGVAGALRRDELYKLKIDDIEDLGTILVVSVADAKNKNARKFTITDHLDLEVYKKYVALRPKNYLETKFFVNFQGGKCTRQVIGINKFGRVPCEIAKYLNLPNAEEYTGHCFRRSSASLRHRSRHQYFAGLREEHLVEKKT